MLRGRRRAGGDSLTSTAKALFHFRHPVGGLRDAAREKLLSSMISGNVRAANRGTTTGRNVVDRSRPRRRIGATAVPWKEVRHALKTTRIGAFPKPPWLPIRDWFEVDLGALNYAQDVIDR